MGVPDEPAKVGVFLHSDGPLAILQDVSMAPVLAIEGNGVAREEAPHEAAQPLGATPHQQVGMVGDQGPGGDGGAGRRGDPPAAPVVAYHPPLPLRRSVVEGRGN